MEITYSIIAKSNSEILFETGLKSRLALEILNYNLSEIEISEINTTEIRINEIEGRLEDLSGDLREAHYDLEKKELEYEMAREALSAIETTVEDLETELDLLKS